MSFSFYAAGTVDQARDQVNAATGYGDTSQFDAVRAFVLSELDGWPATGVLVEASGHHDNSRNVSITMRPLFLPKVADEPEGTQS